MPLLRTWILPIAILLGLNVAFLSPAYLSGDILDQDDIKLGYAKAKNYVITEKPQAKSLFGPTRCSAVCQRHRFLPNTVATYLGISQVP